MLFYFVSLKLVTLLFETAEPSFVGITRADVMADMRADPSFEIDVQNGKEEAFDRLRYQTVQRAIEGIEWLPRFFISWASYNGPSPDRLDAAIWAITALLTGTQTMRPMKCACKASLSTTFKKSRW